MDVEQIRADFPILTLEVHGHPLAYLDNAATSQKPGRVLDKLNEYYRSYNANVHRTIYAIGEKATEEYEEARSRVAGFIGAEGARSIVFTRGTTEAINLVAYAWGRYRLGPSDEILVTEMEHHSNIIPWQLLARDTGAVLRYIPIHTNGTLNLPDDPGETFTSHTRMVAVTHQSNVFGTVNPIERIVEYARAVGALVLVDGAQSVPHSPVNVQELGCDFLAFSGHKMLGPSGVGVLFGKSPLLESMEPFLGGGEMIRTVTMEHATWNEVPGKFEAGTPNIAQAIGLGAAVEYIEDLGIENIHAYEQGLLEYALEVMGAVPEVTIYGSPPVRGAVVSFNVKGIHPHDLAQFLDHEGIAVRAGHHCAQPVMQRLGVPATVRASFYVYNTKQEIDRLAEGVRKALAFLT
ncbi:MAG: cysteine desulfurase [Fidelibacterota bacterium]